MRFCSYVVVHDEGFAPNPFAGFCTLAACTPNHQGLRLARGDCLIGHSSIATGSRLIYAMRISEVLDFDAYYRDPRFAAKKARPRTWQERRGDNIYFRDRDGRWAQALTFFHTRPGDLEKDTRYPRVFISDHFWYFGENAPKIPSRYSALVRMRQGCGCSHNSATVRSFVTWLETTYPMGQQGDPRDVVVDTGVARLSLQQRNSPSGRPSQRAPR
jgi:hypothetical protein